MTAGLFRRDPDVIVAEVDGERRLLHLRSWTYLSFDEIGARIWEHLGKPRDAESLVQALLDEFEGDEAAVRADVAAFLESLRDEGFLIRD